MIYLETLKCYQFKCSLRYLGHAAFRLDEGRFTYEAGMKPSGPLTAAEWLELTAFMVGEHLRHTPLPDADGRTPSPVKLVMPSTGVM